MKIQPMKNKTTRLHSESYARGLERKQANKSVKMKRKQELKNKHVKMTMGA